MTALHYKPTLPNGKCGDYTAARASGVLAGHAPAGFQGIGSNALVFDPITQRSLGHQRPRWSKPLPSLKCRYS